MQKKGREAYEAEIAELKEKLENAEADLRLYDMLFDKIYGAMTAEDAARIGNGKAIQRAMADAYVQWQEDNKQ